MSNNLKKVEFFENEAFLAWMRKNNLTIALSSEAVLVGTERKLPVEIWHARLCKGERAVFVHPEHLSPGFVETTAPARKEALEDLKALLDSYIHADDQAFLTTGPGVIKLDY